MSSNLVIGAGLIGRNLAARLSEAGESVTIASRSGSSVSGVRSVSLDASDTDALSTAARHTTTMFLASSPAQYHRWPELWPPVFESVVAAARTSGARLVMMGNLYAYGEGASMPMKESDALRPTEPKGEVRKAGWELAKAAHDRGDIQAVEVRASDYFGPHAGKNAQLGSAFFKPIIAGKRARTFGSIDVPHSWTYLPDITDTLMAASGYVGEWGRAWHVPSAEAVTRRELTERINALTGANGSVEPFSDWMLRALGVFSKTIRAANDSYYQFTRPFTVDATDTERLLGVRPTPWSESLPPTIESYLTR